MTDFYVSAANMPFDPLTLPLNERSEECINGSLYNLDKGYTPPPWSLAGFDEGSGIRVTFEENPFSEDCTCAIECIGTPSVVVGSDTGVFFPTTAQYEYYLKQKAESYKNR